jgi:hypothetical protein
MKTNYSRRELYALGEPLGNSATYKKATGGYVLGGGGGGSPPPPPASPTTTTVQNTSIPEYAQPYVETMLGATQQQLFNTSTNPDGSVQITGVKPYVPYSQNPSDYIAGFSPMQQQAFNTTANMQVPGQYGAATGMAMGAGMQSMGLAGQEAQAGNRYNQMATNPGAVGAFMNPYVQQSLAPQLQQLAQQTGINTAAEQGAATSAGAFGGSREALMNSLQQQQGNLAAQQAIGQGYNTAYNNAMQNMQYGAGLGLQGQQAAMQGIGQGLSAANQLAGIGGQQLAAQQGIAAAQMQAGTAQQQQQQNIINQAVQNYATAQQYPEQQLSFMNAMLRGLPTQQMTTQGYQAAPSSLSQLTGLGLAGLGAYNVFGGAGGSSGTSGSDINLKENIAKLWQAANGLNVYEFEYKPEFKDHPLCGHGRFLGYMAHEVEKVMPDAVVIMDNGFKAVNYDMIGRAA